MKNEIELITRYAEIKNDIDNLNKEKNEIRDILAQILHDEETNSKIIKDEYGNKWKVTYQMLNRKKVNYSFLYDVVGSDIYDEIVTSEETTSFIIRKAPKKKSESKFTKEAPKKIKKDVSKEPPKGQIEY